MLPTCPDQDTAYETLHIDAVHVIVIVHSATGPTTRIQCADGLWRPLTGDTAIIEDLAVRVGVGGEGGAAEQDRLGVEAGTTLES